MLSYWVSEYFTLGSFGCLPSPRNSDHQYAYHFFKICKNLPLLVEGIVGLKTYTYPPKVQHVSPLKSCRSLTGKACLSNHHISEAMWDFGGVPLPNTTFQQLFTKIWYNRHANANSCRSSTWPLGYIVVPWINHRMDETVVLLNCDKKW